MDFPPDAPPLTDEDAPAWLGHHRARRETPMQNEAESAVFGRLAMGAPRKDGTRSPLQLGENVAKVLRLDSRWRGRLRYNQLGLVVELDGAPLSEHGGLMAIREWLTDVYGLHPGGSEVWSAAVATAEASSYHPIEDWLGSLAWDGRARIGHVAATALGVTDPMASVYLRRFVIGAVARVLSPGCKLDTALILIGEQGARKSTFFRDLFSPQWFGDSPVPIGDKDAYLIMARHWGFEAAEMESLRISTAERVKQFLSSSVDAFRPPYARASIRLPRRSILCGSTNNPQFLGDPTGARRFWPITIPAGSTIDTAWVVEHRSQIWAEAVEAYRAGAPWWLSAEDEASEDRRVALDAAHEEDPWTDLVRTFAGDRPKGFTTLEAYLAVDPGDIHRFGTTVEKCGKREANRIGAILRQMDYKLTVVRDGPRLCRLWVRR